MNSEIDNRDPRNIILCVLLGVAEILFTLLLVMFCSCSSSAPAVETHDTLYVSRTLTDTVYQSRRDSVYVQDSIYIREKGDTVFCDRWHTRLTVKTDTLLQFRDRTDTVYQTAVRTETVTEEVEKPLSWWQRTRIIVGDALIAAVVFFFLWKYRATIWRWVKTVFSLR